MINISERNRRLQDETLCRTEALITLAFLKGWSVDKLSKIFTDWLITTPLDFWDAIGLCRNRTAKGLALPFESAHEGLRDESPTPD